MTNQYQSSHWITHWLLEVVTRQYLVTDVRSSP